jgi:hypothetical protein
LAEPGCVNGHKVGFSVSVGAEKDDSVSFQERDGKNDGYGMKYFTHLLSFVNQYKLTA